MKTLENYTYHRSHKVKKDCCTELKEVLIKLNQSMLPYEDESGVIKIPLHSWFNLKEILKK